MTGTIEHLGDPLPGAGSRSAAVWLALGSACLLTMLSGCQREIDACQRLGTRLDGWRNEVEATLNAGAISPAEWECRVEALEEVDRETTQFCKGGPVMLYDAVANRDRRFALCEAKTAAGAATKAP